ncbi:MAG: hypothetical protein PHF29_09595 [Candidatus Riflebacteria bacterium]|nr:hypothetical protein [Candidatus Riflebacteria bacterium]
MSTKHWSFAILTVMLIILLYSFISTIFKSDQRRRTQGRLYVDYSDYRHGSHPNKPSALGQVGNRNIYRSAREAREVKKKMFTDVISASFGSMSLYNSQFEKPSKATPKTSNLQYEEMIKFANTPIPAYQSGLQLFTMGEYSKALQKFDDAMKDLDIMDLSHRIDVYKMMAECYLKLGNNDGYIQNRIRQVRMERRKVKILQDTFPDKSKDFELSDWANTAAASKNLLRMRTVANRNTNSTTREMLKRAELDLEVARKVTQ